MKLRGARLCCSHRAHETVWAESTVDGHRQPAIAVEPALFASKQTAVEFVSAARQDAGAPDIRMFGIEEDVGV